MTISLSNELFAAGPGTFVIEMNRELVVVSWPPNRPSDSPRPKWSICSFSLIS